ncbi:beta-lactamase [Pyrenochaeta sp. DS3sAY3a]|nr:beta-lactamase [Pyrenochaeta sp. DS3sAY3a]
MAQVQGTCDERFDAVKQLFQSYIDSGNELGASLYVNIDGTEVLDLYGGYASADHSSPWTKDTITNIWSSTKPVTNLAALLCIDRGLLDPFEKAAKYWPEFAANGKENVEVRHFLSHATGVSGWAAPITKEQVCDVRYSTDILATQAPWWEPGTQSGYHSLNMGHLVGELVRRVSGKSLTQFIADELAGPLDADFQLGAKEADWHRVADNVAPPPATAKDMIPGMEDPNSLTVRTLFNPPMTAAFANSPEWRGAEVGAANGHTNARGLGRIVTPVSLGGGNLLSPKTIDLIFKEQQSGLDGVIKQKLRLGIGFGLTGEDTWMRWLPDGRVCVWGGWGGSVVVMDLERKMTVTYVMNKMENAGMGNARTKEYVRAIYKAVGVELRADEEE